MFPGVNPTLPIAPECATRVFNLSCLGKPDILVNKCQHCRIWPPQFSGKVVNLEAFVPAQDLNVKGQVSDYFQVLGIRFRATNSIFYLDFVANIPA